VSEQLFRANSSLLSSNGDILNRFLRLMVGGIQAAAMCCFGGIMMLTAVDVVRRTLFQVSMVGLFELSEVLLVATSALGITIAQARDEHISVSLFTERLPARIGGPAIAIGRSLMLIIVVGLTYSTYLRARTSIQSGELGPGSRPLLLWPARAILFLSFAVVGLMIMQTLTSSRGGPKQARNQRTQSNRTDKSP